MDEWARTHNEPTNIAANWNRAARAVERLLLFIAAAQIRRPILKFRGFLQKHELDHACRPVSLFGEHQISQAPQVFTLGLIHFLAIDEADEICVLFN